MLDNFSETKSTMQSDDIEQVMNEELGLHITNEMTYKEEKEMCSSKIKVEPTIEDSNSYSDDGIQFRGINLEDDIEKVEETSESSEEIDDLDKPDLVKLSDALPTINSIPMQSPDESIKSWLQRVTDMQNEMQKKYCSIPGPQLHSRMNSSPIPTVMNNSQPIPSSTPSRVVKYQDLPYMGEMTLDNSKPRRGRKPKKADICHLIYKNYGTIFPGTPNPGNYLEKDSPFLKKSMLEGKDLDPNRNDVQNKIISSLLEKRLTQEYSRVKEAKEAPVKHKKDQNEPLNLCIRDLNHLKIRLLKKDNIYSSHLKSEQQSDDDSEVAKDTPSPSSTKTEMKFTSEDIPSTSPGPLKSPEGATGPGGFVYWPNAGVFIHPAALQQQLMMYQKMTGGNSYVLPNTQSPKQPPGDNSGGGSKSEHAAAELRKLVPKSIKPKPSSPKVTNEETDCQSPGLEIKRRGASSSESHRQPTKRKRSAIFIPPIPTENNTNPATEVSICKFKFTGGAKPSLQEKKMLSVDSGGNFRYYSGTGDKSMRGYEFFPRETLQQQINNAHGSSTGAFLQASGEKIYPTPPPVDFTGSKTSSEFLLSPELPAVSFPTAHSSGHQDHPHRLKKRKSRKSLQREKLEQTFKEKGFLIQTQQTESAEGATYCKFRQLRKFTRYLFRSWKDYLPGNIAEGEQPRPDGEGNSELTLNELSRDNIDNSSVHSSEVSVPTPQ
ncbi:unnamed protein product [Phaedon cochleariae]|uniref:Uncharacterized protein n=1 Tax=Phaedon cochleariae TaxID=80249 RepID=A0A9N9SH15_PHACE|nr:unnamed protein product [Phaedon cochleariae]